MRVNFRNFHTVVQCGKMKNVLSLKKISSNQLFSNFFSKPLLSQNFCQKSVIVNFRNFHSRGRDLNHGEKFRETNSLVLKTLI